ncbi:histidine phosphatase family protein [Demequina capsici]|uniref:Histidine phosphatase family protein n=1 Tax=Demequina capsici TaxID=3075620 RepID=A0AA96JBP0_9MICO|nr:histidine phosphatase family protein [Demequina sp. PMTSA13]WNM28288.1 histidine phosphatase family protein [Demequina sp. PMTSA13]
MTRLYVVRHGQTDWNLENRLQGSTDIPLNDTGRAQAADAAAGLLAQLTGAPTVVASHLSRAIETAQILFTDLDVVIHRDPRIGERSYGVWEGLEADLRQVHHPEDYDRWKAGLEPRIKGYETHAMLAERTVAAAHEWVQRVDAVGGGDLVLVSHGSAGRMLLASLLGMSTSGRALGNLENACWSRLVPAGDGGWCLDRHNVGAEPVAV